MSKTEFSKEFKRRVKIGLIILLIIAIVGIVLRIFDYMLLIRATNQQAMINVATIQVKPSAPQEELVLPGNVVAWHDSTIYSRTNGYLINWYVDIGAHVKAGQLLAQIATPEIDEQLRQTEAQLKTAEANYALAKTTATRWQFLLKTESVSKQETDEKISAEKAQAAIVASTRANRDRLLALVNFEKIIAPFDGVIMSRTTDIGRLINAGSNTPIPLFRIVQSERLRVYVRVPQHYSMQIKPGLTAKLYFAQHPDTFFNAKLLDTAKAIDQRSRTLLLQLEVDNANNELFAGSYAEVHFLLPTPQYSMRVPVNTLIFQKNGLQVATVSKDNAAILKKIKIGRDYGDEVEVVSGLKVGETIILNPPDSLVSGEKVHIVSSPQPIT